LIDGPILLPVQILGDALGVHWTSISRYLRAAQQAGYLTRLSPHRYSQRLAAEWAFDCGRFAELGEGRP
jgi:hypothetical protein